MISISRQETPGRAPRCDHADPLDPDHRRSPRLVESLPIRRVSLEAVQQLPGAASARSCAIDLVRRRSRRSLAGDQPRALDVARPAEVDLDPLRRKAARAPKGCRIAID